MLNIVKHWGGYVAMHREGDACGLRYLGATIEESIGLAYRTDTRLITRAEQDRVASEYRARCAEEDAR